MAPAKEPARIALLIANSHYEGGTWQELSNPKNDVRQIAAALRDLGFEFAGCPGADVCLDLNREELMTAIRTFTRRLERDSGTLAFFYYSGHGVQAPPAPGEPPENYLIPIRSGVEDENDVPSGAVSVRWLLDRLKGSGAATGIVVLDACRENLMKHAQKSASTRGLAVSDGGDILLAYAAETGHVALDYLKSPEEGLSPYARRLSEELRVRGKSVVDIFIDVRKKVIEDTRGQQKPELLLRVTDRIYLAGPPPAQPARIPAPTGSAQDRTSAPEAAFVPPGGPSALHGQALPAGAVVLDMHTLDEVTRRRLATFLPDWPDHGPAGGGYRLSILESVLSIDTGGDCTARVARLTYTLEGTEHSKALAARQIQGHVCLRDYTELEAADIGALRNAADSLKSQTIQTLRQIN